MDDNKRKIFWNTLCSLDGNDVEEDAKKLETIIEYPTYIYRYRVVNEKNINALSNNKLYFSKTSYYDDPFDTYLHIDYKKIFRLLKRTVNDKEKAFNFLKAIFINHGFDTQSIEICFSEYKRLPFDQLFEKLTVYLINVIQPLIRDYSWSVCFSEDGLNETMWLKYADQYKGFCLIYDTRDENKLICGKKEECNICQRKNKTPLYPMYYSKTRYDATKYALNLAKEKVLRYLEPDISTESLNSQLEPCIWEKEKTTLIKSECHKYDREWRMLLSQYEAEPVTREWIPYGVILGLKTSSNDKKLIIETAKKAGIAHIYKSIIDFNGKLGIVEIAE